MLLWSQRGRRFPHFITNQLMLPYVGWLLLLFPPRYGPYHLLLTVFSYHQTRSILRWGGIPTCDLQTKVPQQRWRGPQRLSESWAALYKSFSLPSPGPSRGLLWRWQSQHLQPPQPHEVQGSVSYSCLILTEGGRTILVHSKAFV